MVNARSSEWRGEGGRVELAICRLAYQIMIIQHCMYVFLVSKAGIRGTG
jgi:hypothetical protein